jgi:hypothetical protein
MANILSATSGVDFDAAWSRRIEAPIDADSGMTTPFVSADDLLAAKFATGHGATESMSASPRLRQASTSRIVSALADGDAPHVALRGAPPIAQRQTRCRVDTADPRAES